MPTAAILTRSFPITSRAAPIKRFHPPTGLGSPTGGIQTTGPAHGVAVVRADGTGPVIDTGPPLSGTARWVWAPDSSKILMVPNDEGTVKAYLLDPNGGPWTMVPSESDLNIDWQRVAD